MTHSLWYKKISLFDIFYILYVGMFDKIEIHTQYISFYSKLILKLVYRGKIDDRLKLNDFKIENVDGASLFYKSQFFSKKIIEDIFNDSSFDFSDSSIEYRNHHEKWKSVVKSKCAHSALELIKFINIIENQSVHNKNNKITISYPISHRSRSIINSYKKITRIDYNIRFKFNSRYALRYVFPGFILYSFFKALKAGIIPKKNTIPLKLINKGTIFEQYAGPVMMNRYPDHSHLFWHQKSNISPDQVIIYADRKDTILSKDCKEAIIKNGFNYIDLMDMFKHVDNPIGLFFKSLKISLKPFKIIKENSLWKWLVIYENTLDLVLKRNIYKKFNVRVIHQHEEWLPKTIIKSLAIKMEDGIFISNLWSITSFPQLLFNFGNSDITFTWGDYQIGFLKSHNFSSNYFINTGLICGDNLDPKRLSKFYNINEKLNSKSNFIIGCFDNSFDSDYWNSFESFFTFYSKIIDIAIENKNFALLIKPKKSDPYIYLKKHTEIKNKYNHLVKEKRLIIVNPEESVSYVSFFSDITISYGISTAGCISILLNKPNIFLNISGNKFHPLKYQSGWNDLIVDSIDELLAKINELKSKSYEINNSMKLIIDKYGDGIGNYRSGVFISDFLNAFDRGLNRDDSLNYALNSYKEKWGKNAVKSEISKNNEGLIIWEKSLSNIDKYFSGSK